MSRYLTLHPLVSAVAFRVTTVLMVFVLVFAVLLQQPAKAISPCDLIPSPIGQQVCKQLANPKYLPDPLQAGGAALQQATVSATTAMLTAFAYAEAQSAASALNGMIDKINNSSAPDLNAQWFLIQYGLVFGFATPVAFVMFFSRASRATKDKDPGELGMGVSYLLLFLATAGFIPWIVNGLTQLFDKVIAPAWLDSAGKDSQKVIQTVVVGMTQQGKFNEQLVTMVIVLIGAVISGVLLAVEFLFREAALYLFTALEVLTFALWIGGRGSKARFMQTTFALVGLILFKLLAAVILAFAIGMIGHPGGSTDPVLYGAFLLMLLPFMTWRAYKAITGHNAQPGVWVQKAVNIVGLLT